MFWSKIWIFLLAIIAAIAVTLALVMPRPAQREALKSDQKRLVRACGVAGILLRDSARNRIQLAGEFSRAAGLDDVLVGASKGEIVSGDAHSGAKTLLQSLNVRGAEALAKRLDVALLDRKGRVVARSGKKASDYGDVMAGYFLVDDALAGYVRDDVWIDGGNLYLVAGSPVVTRQLDWAGAVVVRELIENTLVEELAGQIDASIGFYAGGEAVATSNPAAIHKEVLARFAELPAPGDKPDCAANDPFVVDAGDKSYWVQLARLPGEAGAMGGFYAVFAERESTVGAMATIKAVTKDDLTFKNFPWIPVGGAFLLMVLGGIALTILESDRPLRRLGNDAVALAKGDHDRLDEVKHRGRFGSIARSVNIAIDKMQREAKAAKKDLDNLLGPLPAEGGVSPLPPAGPLGAPPQPFAPPPPSEFKFGGGGGGGGGFDLDIPPPPPASGPAVARAPVAPAVDLMPPPPVALPGAPPAKPAKPPIPKARTNTPPPMPVKPATADLMPATLDDDILGNRRGEEPEQDDEETRVSPGVGGDDDPDIGYFREVFGEFVALKKQCGESIDSLTFAKFSRKLASNRDALIAKHACRTVKFQVYVKDGKAALKASPVKG